MHQARHGKTKCQISDTLRHLLRARCACWWPWAKECQTWLTWLWGTWKTWYFGRSIPIKTSKLNMTRPYSTYTAHTQTVRQFVRHVASSRLICAHHIHTFNRNNAGEPGLQGKWAELMDNDGYISSAFGMQISGELRAADKTMRLPGPIQATENVTYIYRCIEVYANVYRLKSINPIFRSI